RPPLSTLFPYTTLFRSIGAFFAEGAASPYETSVRIPGAESSALRLSATEFRRALRCLPGFQALVGSYAAALYSRICRLTACNVRSEEHTSELQSLRHLV